MRAQSAACCPKVPARSSSKNRMISLCLCFKNSPQRHRGTENYAFVAPKSIIVLTQIMASTIHDFPGQQTVSIADLYTQVRARTMEIVAPLEIEDYVIQTAE